ncbi:hypothetical protein TSAR_016660 [Trichomalopsis sarcophagae]|uniref:Uncharacterized protein n=1 Tax=Trichomalopsis sarcophagae TaxID=543379 RepID=A0A232FBT5_9HYME|nr:hypothetical protein TSAR_016660 [Trichomalopsis sarcophagae]
MFDLESDYVCGINKSYTNTNRPFLGSKKWSQKPGGAYTRHENARVSITEKGSRITLTPNMNTYPNVEFCALSESAVKKSGFHLKN